jgi:hypothetical protein
MHAVVNSTAELLQLSFAISVARFSGWCFMMPSLSRFKKLERYAEKSGLSAIKIFPAPEKKFRGMCETSLTHLSIGQQDICSTLYRARRHRRLQKRTTYSPLLSASQGAYRDLLQRLLSCTCQVNLPAQPLPSYPLSLDATSPAQILVALPLESHPCYSHTSSTSFKFCLTTATPFQLLLS